MSITLKEWTVFFTTNTQVDKHEKLGYESIASLLWKYSLPATIGTLINALYNIVDRIYIGHGAGAYAIAGMAITFPIMNLLGACGMLIGQGSAAQISLFLGKGDKVSANKILGNAVMLALIIFSIVSSTFYVFLDEILIAFGATYNTIEYAKDYLVVILPFHVLTALSFSGNNVMRASGFPTKAMVIMVMGALLNVALDPLFIFTFDMGIQGAAIASVISMGICTIFIAVHFARQDRTIHFQRKAFKLEWRILAAIISIGLSPFLLQIGTSLINLFMNKSLLHYGGDLAVGAFGIITSVAMLVVMTIIGICQGAQPILGYNYGKKQYERVKLILKYTISIGTGLTTLCCITFECIPYTIAKAFGSDIELLKLTAHGMRLYMLTFFLVGSQIIISQYFQSIGRAKVSIFLSISRQILFLIPCIAILPIFWDLDGLWVAQSIANTLAFIVSILCLWTHIKKMNAEEVH